jgi:hypothetical protein
VLVEVAMMMSAEEDEVVEVGGPAVGPMLDVVGLEPAGVPTSGEPADPTISVFELAA